ncbi:MAG: tetratricopeptide repeat protein [Saprospiraceae bacterium]|nr:tetratricopeptide repeat protein [Saprospiraceae bacterium]
MKRPKHYLNQPLPLPSGQTHLYHEYYGDTLFMLKDVDQAMIEWNKSLELNPNNSKLKKKILDKTIK